MGFTICQYMLMEKVKNIQRVQCVAFLGIPALTNSNAKIKITHRRGSEIMDGQTLRILIVEDEALVASGISCCLEEIGYETMAIISDGTEVQKFIKNQVPDLILMDINLPHIDGIAVMEELNKEYDIPCVFITGYSDPQLMERASIRNVYGYLIKPVDVNDLRAVIRVAMARYEDYHKVNHSLNEARLHLAERKVIERAKGLLMDEYEMKEMQAMRYLQKKARESNRRVVDIAQAILDREKI